VKLGRAALAFVGLLPWGRALLDHELPASWNLAVDQAFVAVCHHLPERTLTLHGVRMCVCSRCAGVYAGFLLAALWPIGLLPARRTLKLALEIGLVTMAIDIVTQDLALHSPWHAVRLASGVWVGATLAAWTLSETSRQRFSATASRAKESALASA